MGKQDNKFHLVSKFALFHVKLFGCRGLKVARAHLEGQNLNSRLVITVYSFVMPSYYNFCVPLSTYHYRKKLTLSFNRISEGKSLRIEYKS